MNIVCLNGDHHCSMVRIATEEDIEALTELEALLFPENSLNEKSLADELTVSHALVWGRPVRAYALVRSGSDIIDILRVGVHPNFQRRGLGRLLVEEVLDVDRPVMLTVRRDNTPARSLYEKLGFKVVGALMPNFYALMMVRDVTFAST